MVSARPAACVGRVCQTHRRQTVGRPAPATQEAHLPAHLVTYAASPLVVRVLRDHPTFPHQVLRFHSAPTGRLLA